METTNTRGRTEVTTEIMRGQSANGSSRLCKGTVTVEIRGPQGAGKALVAKLLKQGIGLSPLDTVVVKQMHKAND